MKKIVILGGGESGTGAAILAQKQGFDVFLSDKGVLEEKYRKELIALKIPFEEGMHTETRILEANEVIKSPGIPDKAPLIVELKRKGIAVISEIEFAGRYCTGKTICITGSNGKTTTTLLIYHILKKAGYNVGLGGNIGYSFARMVADATQPDYYVLELSSFQLDGMYEFKADIAILLNITPDHLDRYEYKMENYARSKFRIAQNQTTAQHFIYCADDPETMAILPEMNIKAQMHPFSIEKAVENGGYVQNEILTTNIINTFTMTIHELALQGKHNQYNSLASAMGARCVEVADKDLRTALSDFANAPHRLEFVATIGGISYINDSKATNVNSVWYALESMTNPVVLILGGVDKGNDYSIIRKLVSEKVKGIVCLGKDNERIHKAFEDVVEVIVNSKSATDAVRMATSIAAKGDTVLLSPACASFDLFKNYEDRGDQFKKAVKEL